jgi:hypothetical protein
VRLSREGRRRLATLTHAAPENREPDGYRRLAGAVLRQALADAGGRSVLPCDRETAIRFLGDQDGTLTAWCSVAGLDPGLVRVRVRRLLGQQGHRT